MRAAAGFGGRSRSFTTRHQGTKKAGSRKGKNPVRSTCMTGSGPEKATLTPALSGSTEVAEVHRNGRGGNGASWQLALRNWTRPHVG
jgi:hypothetical protein